MLSTGPARCEVNEKMGQTTLTKTIKSRQICLKVSVVFLLFMGHIKPDAKFSFRG